MNSAKQQWQIVPQQDTENRNAVFFAINDAYAFAAANVIMGLSRHSAQLMKTVDIIIYHNGISEKNMELLRQLHQNIFFIPMQFPETWKEIIEHPRTQKWGDFVICKFFGFELIKKYERVLHLDADMHVMGDIEELFRIEEAFAWREVLGWNPNEVFADLLSGEEKIQCGNGGMLLFTDKLLQYRIDKDTVKAAFLEIKDLKDGGIDETVIAWILHKNGILIKNVDVEKYNTTPRRAGTETRLLHFLDALSVPSKPWVSLAAYLYYDEWRQNYQTWLDMGGEGPVCFAKDDYFRLFAYDQEIKIRKLTKKAKKLGKENRMQEEEILRLNQENAMLREEISGLREKVFADKETLKSRDKRIIKLEAQLSTIRNTLSWRITKPLRALCKFWKKLSPRG